MLDDVLARIGEACGRCGRDPTEVRLVAVTKGREAAEVQRVLLRRGHRRLGENRVQEWRAKADGMGPGIEWHLVGHLQTNKVRFCRPFALLHGVDSARLVEALEADGRRHDHVFPVLLQVNVAGEDTKHGIAPSALGDLLARARDARWVRVEGLMTMAPYDPDPERARPAFRALRELAERHGVDRTSMGMSGDFEVAVEEGATWLRVGRALFEAPPDGGTAWV